MRDSLFVLGTAAVAVVCCFGISLLAAAGGTAVLGFAGIALPVAALLGIGWHFRQRTPRIGTS